MIDTVKGDLHDIGKNDVNKIELNCITQDEKKGGYNEKDRRVG
jgi:methanogenic corrinoid protein MtbC1